MRTLVIDTATQALSVALFEDGVVIAHVHDIVGRGHAEALLPAIAALPDGGRAATIAVDVGPGSFTGVRIGIAAARALAFAWSARLRGYSATALIAAAVARDPMRDDASAPIPVTITGGHGELFWQIFAADGHAPQTPLASTPIAELAPMLDAPLLYGSGAEALVTARGHGSAFSLYPDARNYGLIAQDPSCDVHPLYGRGADARPMAAAGGGA
ncbi:MAG: tRNA (adenosine(37)-N6)-threonylcarbamoyltransferase complex dimerization subunit type 1 TsaB [Sphingobium sp.]|nr:tRNA (adenosine(37)-N6)-threonylcarbamoyltransferase complex dimerization subunit type 1 TsaB [Sphingobium sp.]